MIARLVCHVGDILFTGTDGELKIDGQVLRAFRAGDIEKRTPQSPIISIGSLLGRHCARNWDIFSSQSQYAKELQKVDAAQFAQQGKIINAKKLRTALRQVLGSPIWLTRLAQTSVSTSQKLPLIPPLLALMWLWRWLP